MIIEKDNLPPELVKMLKNQPNPPIMNVITSDRMLSVPKVQSAIDEYIVLGHEKDPSNYAYLSEIRFEPEFHLTMRNFGMVVVYLRGALLIDTTLKFFNFTKIIEIHGERDPVYGQKYMVLDSQALEHLDILPEKVAPQFAKFSSNMTQAERN